MVFPINPALQEIVKNYNITHELEHKEALDTIEEEKLSEIILLSIDNMTLMVNSTNNGKVFEEVELANVTNYILYFCYCIVTKVEHNKLFWL